MCVLFIFALGSWICNEYCDQVALAKHNGMAI